MFACFFIGWLVNTAFILYSLVASPTIAKDFLNVYRRCQPANSFKTKQDLDCDIFISRPKAIPGC